MESPQKFIVAVVGIIIREDKRILALRRTSGTVAARLVWETVSGKVELGEDPFQAVVREIGEESGLRVEVEPRPVATWQGLHNHGPMVLLFYKASYEAGEVKLSTEHDQHAWLSPAEFSARTCYPRLAGLIHELVER